MFKKVILISILLLLPLVSMANNTQDSSQTDVSEIHYKVVHIEHFSNGRTAAKQMQDYLNEQALQGYFLDKTIDIGSGSGTKLLIFKKSSK